MQNLAYALVQVVHNFGAAAVVGAAIIGRWSLQHNLGPKKMLAWLVLIGWITQGLSGAGFGAVSFYYYGQFPEIFGVAVIALVVKMACTIGGVILAGTYLCCGSVWPVARQNLLWNVLVVLGATALSAAAFLRWYS